MSGEAQEDALTRMLSGSMRDPSTRLDALLEEVRVARLVAHMRPYFLSSASAATQPMVAVPPRTGPRPHQDKWDTFVTAAFSAVRPRLPPASPPGPHIPYSGSTR